MFSPGHTPCSGDSRGGVKDPPGRLHGTELGPLQVGDSCVAWLV